MLHSGQIEGEWERAVLWDSDFAVGLRGVGVAESAEESGGPRAEDGGEEFDEDGLRGTYYVFGLRAVTEGVVGVWHQAGF